MSTIHHNICHLRRRRSQLDRRRGRQFFVTFMTAIILCVSSSRDVQRGDMHNRKYTKYTSQEPRQLQDYVLDPGPLSTCNFAMNTLQVDGFSQGDGIVFAMKSKETDDNGVKITSLGFHVPAATTQNVDFQVYALKKEGYYADPNRDTLNQGVAYDYRGNAQIDEWWERISSGTIRKSDLIASETNALDFYNIPFDMFNATDIPPNGGVRSFYISTALLYANLILGNGVNDEQLLVGYNDPAAPDLLVGEGASGFSDTKFMYKTREFVGKIIYETECATEVPSVSISPSTSKPTSTPTLLPTTSHLPTETSMPPTQPAGAEAAILFPLLKCDPNQATVPQEVQAAVSDQVTYTMTEGKESGDFSNFESAVLEAKVICVQRRLTGDSSQHNRLLPTQSSAMQFSVVITGEYRSLDGEPPDLGPVVEDSINADAAKFTKELKARSANPLLEQAMEPQVKARTLDNDELEKFKNDAFEVTIRAFPSPSPTAPPQDKMKTALLIVILIVSGVMVVLASFLLFRHAERRAVENRRKKMEMKHISDQRVSALKEDTLKQEWEKENKMRMASNSWQKMKNESDYPPYYGGAPPQNQQHPHARDHHQDSYEEDQLY
mmetsp:Transcript_3017/g.5091  ORF Transcript_3017/g.5091 Transcript_3017/m.5091 type:complete len:608 (+) Transcript_3017:254-2077(+)